MPKQPDVTFVITGHNVVETVRDAVMSALRQASVSPEVIYVDDGSTDGTLTALEDIADNRLILITLDRVGRVRALNEGVARGRANSIAILDADDVAFPQRACLQLELLTARPEIQAVGGQLEAVDEHGRVDRSGRLMFPTRPEEIDRWIRRGRMPLAHPATMYRRSWFDDVGGYDPSVRRAEDFDLFLRGWTPGCYAAVTHVVTRYRTPLFPSWRYWRREQEHARAVHRRWLRQDTAPLQLKSAHMDIVRDWSEWGAQRFRSWLVNHVGTKAR